MLLTCKEATMPELDLEQVARIAGDLRAATGNLKQHIALEGKKVGDALGVTYAKAAKEQIADAQADAERWHRLNAELRRQMEPLTRDAYAYHALKKRVLELAALAEKSGGVEPARMLRAAIGEANTSARVQWEREQADAKRQQELAGG